MSTRLVYWNNIPSPYMVARFNALADLEVFEFEAWFNDRRHRDRSWEVDESDWRFVARYLPRTIGGLSTPTDSLRRFRPDVLISLFAEPSFMLGWAQARRMGTKTAFRVLAPSPAIHPRHALKERAKRFMFRRADALLVPGPDARAYALSYGIPEHRVMRESQVVDAEFFTTATERARADRATTRAEHSLRGTTFLYVGRLLRSKRLFELIEAFRLVRATREASLLLIGDGADEHELRRTVSDHRLDDVVFAGFVEGDSLPRLMAAADVFVFPTYGDAYGLVVDEAMAAGLPVISSTAAGEIRERVKPDVTGMLVPPQRVRELSEAMARLAWDEMLRLRLGEAARRFIASSSPARWARDIEEAVRAMVETP